MGGFIGRQYKLLGAIYRVTGIRPLRKKVFPLMFGPAFLADPACAPVICDAASPVAKSQRIAEMIPGARLEVVPGAGHTSTLEQPAAVTRLIREFLESRT